MKKIEVVIKRANMTDERLAMALGGNGGHPVFKGVVEIIDRMEDELLGPSQEMNVPAEVKQENYAKIGALRELRAQMIALVGEWDATYPVVRE